MTDKNPYDKSLHDKLSRLPVPDVEKTWPQMRMLLDEEMPEGGRSKRRGGWWFFSAILIFIIIGGWTLMTFNFSKQNVDPPLSATKNTSPPQAGDVKPVLEKGIDSEKPGVADDKTLLSKKITNDKNGSEENQKQSLSTNTQTADKGTGIKPITTGEKATSTREDIDNTGDRTRNEKPVASSFRRTADQQATSNSTVPEGSQAVSVDMHDRNRSATNITDVNSEPEPQAPDPAMIVDIARIPTASFAEYVDSIDKNYGSYVTYTPVSRKYYRQNKKYGKPVNVRQPYSTVGRNFAIGLSLPLAFPLGDQKALGYNVNAGPNTVSDYIPAPHAQYHFNAKAYIQSELQLLSPQYIKPALLYETHTTGPLTQTTNSVSAQKLYYFNVPVSLHYSPFKHFYMGTGLQFSSLLSGVAMHEQIRTGMVPSDSIYRVSYTKFSNDSISSKLNSNEMRLMLDANYYWNKFTVGLRYNQALSNYVSTRASPGSPITVDKNKSLQFYMRWNLWEDKKKTTGRTLVVR